MSRFEPLRSAASTTRKLAGAWAANKTRKLQSAVGAAESWVADGGDTAGSWQDRRATREQLEEYHKVRQDGGIVASLLEARSLMVFGPGFDFQSPDDVTIETDEGEELTAGEWLNRQLNDRDNLAFDIGTDAYFYGFSLGELVETRGGDFSHVELIQPWTTVPERDENGEIERWHQEIKVDGETMRQQFGAEDVVHFKAMKASGRDRVGMSLLGRGMDEAKAYRDNQEAIRNAVRMQGFPKFHVKAGREGGAVIDDNELRRMRPMFENINEKSKFITGQDVEIDVIEAENFEIEGVTNHDLSKLAMVFMLPVEVTQIGGGDGLGTGFPAKLRQQLFLMGARAHQRLVADQLVQQVGRPLLEKHSLFEDVDDIELEAVFDDPIVDMDELSSKIDAVGDAMTVNERRSMFDLPPLEDEDLGEQFGDPSVDDERGIESNESDDGFPGGGGMFSEGRELSEGSHWDEHFLSIYEDVLWADEGDSRTLFGFSESGTPEFVKDRIRDSILSGDAVFSDIDGIPDQDMMEFRLELLDTLTDDGWTISELKSRLQDLQPGLEDHEAEVIARTETQSTVNHARELGYEERDDADDLRFRWVGPGDGRTTDVCESIKERVPEGGLSLSELQEVVHEEAREHDHDPRDWTPHVSCRHTFVRAV